MADQKLQFNVGMSTEEFVTGTKELAKMVKSLETTVANVGKALNGTFSGYAMSAHSAVKASKDIEAEIKRLQKESANLRAKFGRDTVDSQAYIELTDKIRTARQELRGMRKEQDKLNEKGVPQNVAAWKDAKNDVEEYEKIAMSASKKAEEAYQKYLEISKNNNGVGPDVEKAKARYEQERALESQRIVTLSSLRDKVIDMENKGYAKQAQQYDEFLKKRSDATKELASLEKQSDEMARNGSAYTRTETTEFGKQLIEQQRAIDDRIKVLSQINDSMRSKFDTTNGAFDFLREAPYNAPKAKKGETIDTKAESEKKELNSLNEEYRATIVNISELIAKKQQLHAASAGAGTEEIAEYSNAIQQAQTWIDYLQQELDELRDTGVDASALTEHEEEIQRLKDLIEEYRAEIDFINTDGGEASAVWDETIKALDDAKARLDSLRSAMQEMGAFELDPAKELKQDLAESMIELQELQGNRDALAERHMGADPSSAIWAEEEEQIKALDARIADTTQHIEDLRQKLESPVDDKLSGKEAQESRTVSGETENKEKVEGAKEAAEQSAKVAQTFLDKNIGMWQKLTTASGMAKTAMATAFAPILHPIQVLDRAIGAIIQKAGRMVGAFARMAGSGAVSFIKKLASGAKNAAIQLARLAAKSVTTGLKRIASAAGAAAKGILNFNKHTRSSSGGLQMGLKNVLKYAFGIRSLFFLFRRLRAAISEGFGELKKQDPEVRAALDGLSKALSGLKGSLATAFSPILTAVAPALTSLINMLTSAINSIGMFLAALTGKKSVAVSVGAIGSSASGSSKAVKELKRELAGFDELNILNANKDNGGGGGGGSGGGLSYKNVPVEGGLADFADQLKEKWSAGDYEGVGTLIAQKINGIFTKAEELVSWDNLEDKITAGVDAITGVINGLINPETGIDFETIGSTIGEGINTVLETLKLLLSPETGFDFDSAGKALANGLNGLFGKEDMWTNVMEVITSAVRRFIDFSRAFLVQFDEGTLAKNIRTALTTDFGWDDIASEVWKTIKLAFNKAGNFLNVLLGGTDFSKVSDDAQKYMRKKPVGITPEVTIEDNNADALWDELAKNIGAGFKDAVVKLTQFIEDDLDVEGVVTAITDWLGKVRESALGDGSEIGTLFGTAFKKIFDGFEAAAAWFKDNAKQNGETLAGAINAAIEAAFPEGESGPGKVFSDLVIGAFDFIGALLEGFNAEDAAQKLKDAIADVDWKGIAESAWNAFKTAVAQLGNFLTVLFGDEPVEADLSLQPADNRVLRKQGKLNDTSADTTAQGLAKSVGSAISNMLDALDNWINDIKWEDIGTGLNEFLSSLPWDEWGQKLANALSDLFNGLDDFISTTIFGDNYKEDDRWRALHPQKAADYDAEKLFGVSKNAARILEERSMTADDFARKKQEVNGVWNPETRKAAVKAAEEIKEIEHEINLADALDAAKQTYEEEGYAGLDDLITELKGLDLTLDETNEVIGKAGFATTPSEAMSSQAKTMFDSGNYSIDEIVAKLADTENEGQAKGLKMALESFGVDALIEKGKTLLTEGADYRSIIDNFAGLGLSDDQIAALEAGLQDALSAQMEQAVETLHSQELQDKLYDAQTEEGYDPSEYLKILADEIIKNKGDQTDDELLAGLEESGVSSELLTAVTDALNANTEAINANSETKDSTTGEDVSYQGEQNVQVEFKMNGETGTPEETGEYIVDGVTGAIEDKKGDLEDSGAQIIEDVSNAADEAAEINSPSKLFYDKGEFIVQGFINGLSTLKGALNTVWDDLPTWAQNLLANSDMDIGLNLNGTSGDSDNQQTKVIKKNTKALNANTKAQGGDSKGDTNSLNIAVDMDELKKQAKDAKIKATVNFVPGGEDADESDENANDGLLGWLQELLDPGVDVQTKIELVKDGWTTFLKFLGIDTNSPLVQAFVKLIKEGGWTSFLALLGIDTFEPTVDSSIKQKKQSGWQTFLQLIGLGSLEPTVDSTVNQKKQNGWQTFLQLIGLSSLNPTVDSTVNQKKQNGWQTFLQLIGLSSLNPTVDSTVNQKKQNGWQTFLQLLGINTLNPTVDSTVNQKKQNGWQTFLQLLGINTLNPTVDSTVNQKKQNGWQKLTALFGIDSLTPTVTTTVNQKTQSGWQKLTALFGVDTLSPTISTTIKQGLQSGWQKLAALFGIDTLTPTVDSTVKSKVATGFKTFFDFIGVESTTPDVDGKVSLSKSSKGSQTVESVYSTDDKSVVGKTKLEKSEAKKTAQSVDAVYTKAEKALSGLVSLVKGTASVSALYGNQTLKATVELVKKPNNKITWTYTKDGMNPVFEKLGGIISSTGKVTRFASGGSIMNSGRASWWNGVNKYAAGTSKAHGTVFVAGEAGPEIMGHVNGRTEILNKSQLADALYSAVVSGMTQAVNALGSYLANHMTTCTNAIVNTIGANAQINSVRGLDYYAPAITTGGVLPYDVAAQIAQSSAELQRTMEDTNEDLIQAMVSAIGNAANTIIAAMQQNSRASGSNMTAQSVIDEINRRTLMGMSPLKGV